VKECKDIGNQKTKVLQAKAKKKSSKTYRRRVSPTEIQFLKTLWKWKVLSYPLAWKICFSFNGFGRFYNKIRRLIIEGYVTDAVGDGLDFHVLQLTKKGFNLIQHDLGELRELRYAPQSVAHDYWATAFQLGSLYSTTTEIVTHISEQEIQGLASDLLPDWVPTSRDHIADGLFKIGQGEDSLCCALEVDINLKSLLRYDKAAYYFDGADSKIDVVFWLCGNLHIAQTIYNRLQSINLNRLDIHHALVTDDFRNHGWNALARSGQFAGKKIQEIYALKSRGNPVESPLKPYGKEEMEILFPTLKTPFKKTT
jgi:hypothetical protein